MFYSPFINSSKVHLIESADRENREPVIQAVLIQARDQAILKIVHTIWEEIPLDLDFNNKEQLNLFFKQVHAKFVNIEELQQIETLGCRENKSLQELTKCINALFFSTNPYNTTGLLFKWMEEAIGREETEQLILVQAYPFAKSVVNYLDLYFKGFLDEYFKEQAKD